MVRNGNCSCRNFNDERGEVRAGDRASTIEPEEKSMRVGRISTLLALAWAPFAPTMSAEAARASPAIAHVDLPPGTKKTLTLTLKPGNYILMCNQPDHYKTGMKANLSVTQ
jgi:uncharacterized cupredoxin-like copper-binding protein